MLKPYKLADYQDQFQPEWAFIAAEDCLPDEVLVPNNHFFLSFGTASVCL